MARIINRDPVEGLVQYINDIKPYHTKIISVLVEYIHTDYLNVTFTEDFRWQVGILFDRYDPACPTGFDLNPYDDILVEPPIFLSNIIDVDASLDTFTVHGDFSDILVPGASIRVQDSTGNDGVWIVTTAVYTPLTPSSGYTTISVSGNIMSAVVDGDVYQYLTNFDYPLICETVSETNVHSSFIEELVMEFGNNLVFFDTINAYVCDNVSDTQYGGISELPIDVDTGTNIFTFTDVAQFIPLQWNNGYRVYFQTSGTLPAPLVSNIPYFLIKLSPTTFQVALTYEDSGATGDPIVPIDITTTGAGISWLIEALNIDYWDRCGWSSLTNLAVKKFTVDTGTEVLSTYGVLDSEVSYHTWSTGDRVYLDTSDTLPSPLTIGTSYYVIWVSNTTIKLAASLADAQLGTAINITDVGIGTHYVEQTKPFIATQITLSDSTDVTYPAEGLSSGSEMMILPGNMAGIGSNADTTFLETFAVYVTAMNLNDTIGVGFEETTSESTITVEGGAFLGSYGFNYFDIGSFDETISTLKLTTGSFSSQGYNSYLLTLYDGTPINGIWALSVAVDSTGNTYQTGYTSVGSYLLKLDSYGVIQWQRQQASHWGETVAVDTIGNVYMVGGPFAGGVSVLKYNSSGVLQWQRLLGSSQYGTGVITDSLNNVYVLGAGADWVVAKYDSSGVIQWQRTLSSAGTDYSATIRVDSTNNVYVIGSSNVGGTFDGLLAKYDSSGVIQWQRTLSAAASADYGVGVCVDTSDNVYVAFSSAVTGPNNIIIVKYNSSGAILWQRSFGDAALETGGYGVVSDGAGNVYILGTSDALGTRDFIFAMFDSTGTLVWQRKLGSSVQEYPASMAIDAQNNLHIVGTSEGTNYIARTFKFPTASLPETGMYGNMTLSVSTLSSAISTLTDAAGTHVDAVGALSEVAGSVVDTAGVLTHTIYHR